MQKQFIPKRKDRQPAPLSFAQQRLWFLDQLEPNSPRYNVSRALSLRGKLNLTVLQEALDAIVIRHETLRSNFRDVDGLPVLVIRPSVKTPMTFVDLSDQPIDCRENTLIATLNELVLRPYNLSTDAMLRASLVRLTQHDHVLLLVLPHITSDGWSMVILCRELMALYDSLLHGQPYPLPDLPIQYADYAVWQREWLQGEMLDRQISYWGRTLAQLSDLNLPTDRRRPAMPSCRNGAQSAKYPQHLTHRLNSLTRTERTTLFMTLLAAFNALLYRYTGQNDIAIGCPIANRQYVELEGLIGFFANTLVFRNSVSGNPTFRNLMTRVREVALGAYEHQDVPFEKLVEEVQPDRDLSRSPLLQVTFQLRNYPSQLVQLPEMTVEPFELHSGIAKFDLSLAMTNEVDGLKAEIEYNPDLFEPTTITRMLGHYERLLEGIVDNPEQRIDELPLLSEAEKHQLLVEWNQTKREYPSDKCIHELFEEQVGRSPEATAVVCGDNRLSYREFNERANQLAHHLRAIGVKPNTLVALCLNRSIELMVAVYGVLKAGGTYLPVDPGYPQERLEAMLQGVQASIVITQGEAGLSGSAHVHVVDLGSSRSEIEQQSIANPGQLSHPSDLIYVIFTSGSTGRPKGAAVYHQSFTNLVEWYTTSFEITAKDKALVISSPSFDLTQKNFFSPLILGGEVHLVAGEEFDPDAINRIIAEQKITLINCTPSAFYPLVEQAEQSGYQELRSLREVFLGGEAILLARLRHWLQSDACHGEIVNTYGPTECTDVCAFYRLDRQSMHTNSYVPLGRPIDNVGLVVVDEHSQLCAIGVIGELCIAGDGVGAGYVNDAALTREKFVANPFNELSGETVYKSGDLVRYLRDGNLEYLGRRDHQVKIRGHRIELGEIEAVLGQLQAVQQAVVLAREDQPGDRRLVAYVVTRREPSFDSAEARKFLKQKLPEYMIPSAFMLLDELPLTSSGKIDRGALPVPDQNWREWAQVYREPLTPTETTLAAIWREVLKLVQIGIHDNFFDLGGQSLLAVQIVSRIRSAFSIEFPLRTLFEIPTIAEIAVMIEQNQAKQTSDPELAQMLREVESMTEEEAQKIVAK